MSGFPDCSHIQQNVCSCPTCLGQIMLDTLEPNVSFQQYHSANQGGNVYRLFGDISTNHLDTNPGPAFDGLGLVLPAMTNPYSAGDHCLNEPTHQGFTPINAPCREDSHNSPGEIQQLHTPRDRSQSRQPDDTGSETLSLAFDQQAKSRPKRKSKYDDEPPESPYGPPFVTREISVRMGEEEIRERVKYNEAVAEARKVFMRHKNNLAAKKSRERKQNLIDELTAETKRLAMRLRQAEAANRDRADSTARLNALQNENGRLKYDNAVLRNSLEQFRRRLDEMIENQREIDRWNSMWSPPPMQTLAPIQTVAPMHTLAPIHNLAPMQPQAAGAEAGIGIRTESGTEMTMEMPMEIPMDMPIETLMETAATVTAMGAEAIPSYQESSAGQTTQNLPLDGQACHLPIADMDKEINTFLDGIGSVSTGNQKSVTWAV
ncbi:hypothetical protein GGS21DRAFT_72308 [Xylaria nigripes]|nr:hypothetical protein GGS21DRAFT_72308 [Xylaria nigripes]